VANDLRFVDQPHFTRHFKRVVGVTPSVYARAELFGGRHRRRETC
jgi:AraC-like DNA-binding protein